MFRDLSVWMARASECRNPMTLAQAAGYERDRSAVLALGTGLPASDSRALLREIEDDAEFIGELRASLQRHTHYQPRAIDFMLYPNAGSVFFNEVTVYAIVRAHQPDVMIETGGTPGKSTAFILQAMARNGKGALYTIDLPPQAADEDQLSDHKTWHERRPEGAGSNWIVPDRLRERHTLLLGKSSEHLPPLLEKLGAIDIFMHDSDHSYENMVWEFETAIPALKPDGLVLSDDVLANDSFPDICKRFNLRHANAYNIGVARR